ncbi:hypothetical protein MRB53_008772 [Persea americana]|uniref:Uncharacterized protein n=1 Tax=Persea americana TaxID=3435 RepID=A0ACC2LMH5_PERAE|nr:hypothetical protein MRB53_008772 [Persea americana]
MDTPVSIVSVDTVLDIFVNDDELNISAEDIHSSIVDSRETFAGMISDPGFRRLRATPKSVLESWEREGSDTSSCEDPLVGYQQLQFFQSSYPTYSCGAGKCILLTEKDGKDAGRKYFACPVKKPHVESGDKIIMPQSALDCLEEKGSSGGTSNVYNMLYQVILYVKAIDEYASLRFKVVESNEATTEVDPRLEAIVERMLDKCISDGRYQQAMGSAIECRRLDKLEQAIMSSDNVHGMTFYCIYISRSYVNRREYLCEVKKSCNT